MTSDLIKLILILSGGVLVIVVGFIFQQKQIAKKKKELDMMNNQYNPSNETISSEEKTAKEYIESYKSQFPRDSIKQALLQSGNSEINVENWLNKYF